MLNVCAVVPVAILRNSVMAALSRINCESEKTVELLRYGISVSVGLIVVPPLTVVQLNVTTPAAGAEAVNAWPAVGSAFGQTNVLVAAGAVPPRRVCVLADPLTAKVNCPVAVLASPNVKMPLAPKVKRLELSLRSSTILAEGEGAEAMTRPIAPAAAETT